MRPGKRLATWVASLTGWRRALFTVALGVLSVLAFAPLHIWFILFITFGPLIWLLDGCHRDHQRLGERLKCAAVIVGSDVFEAWCGRIDSSDAPIKSTNAPSPSF